MVALLREHVGGERVVDGYRIPMPGLPRTVAAFDGVGSSHRPHDATPAAWAEAGKDAIVSDVEEPPLQLVPPPESNPLTAAARLS